jgi:hypothetical protein
MESFIYSGQSLKNYDTVESDIKSRSKNIAYLDLSNNYLE